MRILDIYILKELARPFLFGIFAFSTVFIGGGTLWRIAQYISKYGASKTVVAKLFIYSLPGVIVITIPMSMLLAALLCFGRLSGSSEVIAMRAGGQNFFRLALPVFIASFLIAIGAIVFNETVVPAATAAYNYLVRTEIEGNTHPMSQNHLILVDSLKDNGMRMTYARKFDQATNSMSDVTVQEFRNSSQILVENAREAVWQSDGWMLYSGVLYDLAENSQRIMQFDRHYLPLEKSPQKIGIEQKKPEEMTIKELKQQIKTLNQFTIAKNIYEVELQQRLALPMATFVFGLIGSPLGLSRNRSSSSIGLGLSILIVFVYYIVMTWALTLGQSGKIPPVLAAWLPDIVGLIIGGYFVYRTDHIGKTL